jgi:hypothetical protein
MGSFLMGDSRLAYMLHVKNAATKPTGTLM